MSRIRVVIADDHAVVRQGIRAVLEGVEGLDVVGEAGTGADALRLVREHRPDVLVLDVNMPEGDGLEVTATLRNAGDACHILILSMHDDPEYVLQALRLGAEGYVLKEASPAELREAVRTVADGRQYVREPVTHQLSIGLREELERERQSDLLDHLTPRERQVMLRVARGKTSREIAEEFGISPRTVETHRERVMAKLQVGSVAELTRYVLETGVEDDDDAAGDTRRS